LICGEIEDQALLLQFFGVLPLWVANILKATGDLLEKSNWRALLDDNIQIFNATQCLAM